MMRRRISGDDGSAINRISGIHRVVVNAAIPTVFEIAVIVEFAALTLPYALMNGEKTLLLQISVKLVAEWLTVPSSHSA